MRWMMVGPLLLASARAGAQVVSGTVERYDGGYVPYASVTVVDARGAVVGSTFADRGGRFTLHLPAGGQYRLRVVEEDFVPTSFAFRVQDNGSYIRRVRLQQRGTLSGPTYSRETGAKADGRGAGREPGRRGGGGRRTPAGRDN